MKAYRIIAIVISLISITWGGYVTYESYFYIEKDIVIEDVRFKPEARIRQLREIDTDIGTFTSWGRCLRRIELPQKAKISYTPIGHHIKNLEYFGDAARTQACHSWSLALPIISTFLFSLGFVLLLMCITPLYGKYLTTSFITFFLCASLNIALLICWSILVL